MTKNRDFLIIGHAGGDSNRECENTLESTQAALSRSLVPWTRKDLVSKNNHPRPAMGGLKCLVQIVGNVSLYLKI